MRAYFDHNATAPLDPEVLAAMEPYLRGPCGNASSRHEEGRAAHDAVERARGQVAAAVNARPDEVVFTSSGTESNNTIIKGVATVSDARTIVTSAVEHPCVHCAARAMQRRGHVFAPIGVDDQGLLDFDDLESTLASAKASIVSVMLANNESGVLQDVAKVAEVGHGHGAVVHTDAAQALGKMEVDFAALGVDAMTISAHKARGPMGVAALVVKTSVEYEPLLEGGGHENGARSGTLNVPAIVGFGKAAELAAGRQAEEAKRLAALRDGIEASLEKAGAVVFGKGAPRLPNTTYFGMPGIEGESLVVMLDQSGFAVASGSACASTKNEPSHVLLAMGMTEEVARTAVRVSLGAGNDEKQAQGFVSAVTQVVERMAKMAAMA